MGLFERSRKGRVEKGAAAAPGISPVPPSVVEVAETVTIDVGSLLEATAILEGVAATLEAKNPRPGSAESYKAQQIRQAVEDLKQPISPSRVAADAAYSDGQWERDLKGLLLD